jgi:lysophospholipase L1-like esterase
MYRRVTHFRRTIAGVTALLAAAAGIAIPASNAVAGASSAVAGEKQVHELDTWTAAPADIGGVYSDTTVRNIVHTSIGGSGLRIRLSNAFGSGPVTFDDVQVGDQLAGAATVPGSNRRVTFSGQTSVTIPKGAEALSDPLPGTVAPGTNLAVSVHWTGFTGEATGHPDAQQDNYASPPGDVAGSDNASAFFPNTYGSWYFVDGVVLDAPKQTGEVVALGDSITDGYQSTVNANRRWPDDLARRLLQLPAPRQLSVANEGISANDVTADRCPSCGVSAEARLQRDVLSQPGVSTVIFLEGINDIGSNAVTSAAQLIAADKQIIAQVHADGLRILGGTLTPIKGSGYYSPQHEQIREAVNQWIRTSGEFDGVIDFDKATRDPADPQMFLPAYDSGDHLHPNDAGYQAMADAVDIASLTDTGK